LWGWTGETDGAHPAEDRNVLEIPLEDDEHVPVGAHEVSETPCVPPVWVSLRRGEDA
jgi:hypothetical protein